MRGMGYVLNSEELDALHYDLCVILGICPQLSELRKALAHNPPGTVDEFIGQFKEADGSSFSNLTPRVRELARQIVKKHLGITDQRRLA